jgi:hypothetical protein
VNNGIGVTERSSDLAPHNSNVAPVYSDTSPTLLYIQSKLLPPRQVTFVTCVIIQRICHPLKEKRKCRSYEKKGDIEQQGTETIIGDE